MRLGPSDQAKAEDVGKGGRQTVDRQLQDWGGRGACIASKALLPRETPMRALCSGDDMLVSQTGVSFGWWRSHRQENRFGSHHLHPSPSELTPGPIPPKDRRTRGRFRHRWSRVGCCLNRRRGTRLRGGDRPENRTDPSGFGGGKAFLTLGSQATAAAIADASGIQQTVRAITLGSAFLWVERMIGGTEQASIGLKRKSRPWKAGSPRRACPLSRAIQHSRSLLGDGSLLDRGSLRGLENWGEFGCLHGSRREVLSEFQTKIPHPLAENLPEFLPASGMRTPAVRLLLGVFIGQNDFKGPSMQIQIQHIGWRVKAGEGSVETNSS